MPDTFSPERAQEAAERVYAKLMALDPLKLDISDYSKRYLSGIRKGARGQLTTYALICSSLLHTHAGPLERVRFLDYGGGTGILSVLAAEMGVGHVYYNDIYDVSCADSQVIAMALGFSCITRISGDVDAVVAWCRLNDVAFDGIGSYDVLEHIYDIHDYLKKLRLICAPQGRVFLCSGANAHNPQIVKDLMATHMRLELTDREDTWGRKQRDSLQSYLGLRREMIRNALQKIQHTLPDAEVEKLARATRGLAGQDIIKAVAQYVAGGHLPQPDVRFPSNTCDPMTGNWAERLMDFEELAHTLRHNGFSLACVIPEPEDLPTSPAISLYAQKD